MADREGQRPVDRRTYLKVAAGAVGVASLAGCSTNSGNSANGSSSSASQSSSSGGSSSSGSGSTSTTSKSGGGSNGPYNIGFSSYVRGGSWITAYNDAAKYYASDNDIKLDVRPNRQSSSKQIKDIRDFTNKGYDGIIVGVWSTGAAKSAIDYAMGKGVPVMSTNADTASSKIPLYVGFGNYAGAHKCGVQMVEALQKQYPNKSSFHVLNIRGPQGNQSANQRSQGFVDVMKKHDNVTIDKTINAKFAQPTAQTKVQQYINANGTPDGIYSGNLSMGLGSYGALKNLGKLHKMGEKGHIVLTQMDGSPRVNPLVGKQYIDAAVDQPNYFYNPIALKYMVEYIEAGGVNGGGDSVIPKVGSTVKKSQLSIQPHQHKGVNLWETPIWAPATIKKENGHPWFQTNSVTITQSNYDKPYLWGNIWGKKS